MKTPSNRMPSCAWPRCRVGWMMRIGRPSIVIDVARVAVFIEQALAAVAARFAQRLKLTEAPGKSVLRDFILTAFSRSQGHTRPESGHALVLVRSDALCHNQTSPCGRRRASARCRWSGPSISRWSSAAINGGNV